MTSLRIASQHLIKRASPKTCQTTPRRGLNADGDHWLSLETYRDSNALFGEKIPGRRRIGVTTTDNSGTHATSFVCTISDRPE